MCTVSTIVSQRLHSRRFRSRALGLIVVGSFALCGWQGIRLGLDVEHVSLRYSHYTVPISISQLVYGHAPDNAGYADVAKLFTSRLDGNGGWLNETIVAALRIEAPIDRQAHWYIVADDKGLIDFNKAAFSLFGFRSQSLYLGFFSVLSLSVLVFLLAWRDDPRALVALSLLGAGFYSVLFVLPLTDQLGSVHEPRFLEILGVVPLLHLVWLLADPRRAGALQLACAALQIAILVFVLHLRSSAGWQVACLGAAFLLLAWCALRGRIEAAARRLLRAAAVLALLWLGLLGTWTHVERSSHEAYRSKHALTHVFWHNVFMGFAVQPDLADDLELAIDDTTVTRALERHLLKSGRAQLAKQLFGDVHYAGENFRDFDWVSYEPLVRELFWHTLRDDPGHALAAFFVSKPALFLHELLWAAGLIETDREGLFLLGHRLASDDERRARELYLNPLRPELLLLGLLLLSLAWADPGCFASAGRALGWLAAFSFLPLLLVCPLFQYSGVAFCLVAALLQAGLLLGASAGMRSALARMRAV